MSDDFDDMCEKPREVASLIRAPRPTRRTRTLRGIFGSITNLPSWRTKKSASAVHLLEPIIEGEEHGEKGREDDDDNKGDDNYHDVDLSQPPRSIKRSHADFCVVSAKVAIFIVVSFTVGLCIGGGIGLGIPYYDSFLHAFEGPDPSSFSPSSSSLSFNEYGIPDNLPVIPATQLINHTELRLQTNFTVSRATTTREYVFNISHALAAPDGFYKPMILANGQSPGPLIEANTGDTVRVTVHNQMPNTTTSIHFHGINQNGTTWMDGVTGVTQCGIPAAGGTWTYEFVVAGQRGTFWWHAHTGVQFTDGLFGPIVSIQSYCSLTCVEMGKDVSCDCLVLTFEHRSSMIPTR